MNEHCKLIDDFGNQYSYFKEDIDPKFPEGRVPELDIMMFCDSDHAHDKVTGRSITGLLGFVGSTPVLWRSKRQSCVHTSTFGAEFTALKAAVEEILEIRYFLRSMGVHVTKPTPIFVDNLGVVINATDPSSSLNKKAVALAYHFVREHQAGKVISVHTIHTSHNYADPLTKALPSTVQQDHYGEILPS